jgi:hypothetical protein
MSEAESSKNRGIGLPPNSPTNWSADYSLFLPSHEVADPLAAVGRHIWT